MRVFYLLNSTSAITTRQLTLILLVTACFFIVLIAIAIIKMYRLKAENKRLMETNAFRDVDESYKDFTTSHLYDDEN